MGAFLAWVAVSSMRAGGDQWDNPRYRAIFLPIQAILFGWAWMQQREKRDAWFWVIQGLVWIDVLLFTLWYLPRRGFWGISMPFFNMVAFGWRGLARASAHRDWFRISEKPVRGKALIAFT